MITRATCSVAMTTISDTRFGRICGKMMRGWLHPSARRRDELAARDAPGSRRGNPA